MNEERLYGNPKVTLDYLEQIDSIAPNSVAADLFAHIRELLAEVEEYKGDALRFRWDQQCSHFFESQALNKLYDRKNSCDWPTLDECRAAYDAAIEASEGCMDA